MRDGEAADPLQLGENALDVLERRGEGSYRRPSQLPRTSRSTNDFGNFASNAWSQTSRIWVLSKPTKAHERKASDVPRHDASKGGRSSSVDAVAASSDSSESDASSSLIKA